ncbi:uncharacterized protein STEHIDRAFT_169627 [Stereum hirsutum FP-91666 SS1]|uniref:uncharacterized protein n=1 Tax=Stereum hirsutum (strain FP-91666) TaxID=721885 RepID=UPI0004449FCF|nr:uncharacterized protein STEHIDRAFT_169627 [Stereum hirsutum FP-91666 SS1]EIM84710.1 hypothetical protein STEHIDRAFT_169627 [Stereum hirsutum FP-91666 SS1]
MTGSSAFSGFRIGHAGGTHRKVKRADSSCSTGGFYLSPSSGDTIEYTSALNISWDTTCLDSTNVDIYLNAPAADTAQIYKWTDVYNSYGYYETYLEPKWWNSTSSVSLQLTIVESGTLPAMATLPAGPVFTGTYTASASGSTPSAAAVTSGDSTVTKVNNAPTTSSGLSGGKIAAAVIMPLLVVGALIFLAWFKLFRARHKEKHRAYGEHIDKRMSTISTDWKSMTPSGAQAAIRNSMAVPGNRASSFSFGAIRPPSTFDADGTTLRDSFGTDPSNGQAPSFTSFSNGTGLGGMHANKKSMSQLRPGTGLRTANPTSGERMSRVSFAADVRPSSEYTSRKSIASRAFHTSVVVPPVPQRQDSAEMSVLSPTQRSGPVALSVEDINARLSVVGGNGGMSASEEGDVGPALQMMANNYSQDDVASYDSGSVNATVSHNHAYSMTRTPSNPSRLSMSYQLPASPPPIHATIPTVASPTEAFASFASPTSAFPTQTVSSPTQAFMPMQSLASFSSPDDMLKAYAERRTGSPALGASSGLASPPAAYNGLRND